MNFSFKIWLHGHKFCFFATSRANLARRNSSVDILFHSAGVPSLVFSLVANGLTSCSINYRVACIIQCRGVYWSKLRRTRTHYPLPFSRKNKDPFSLRPLPLTLCVQGFALCQIIWLASRAGKMSQIMRCDELPEQAISSRECRAENTWDYAFPYRGRLLSQTGACCQYGGQFEWSFRAFEVLSPENMSRMVLRALKSPKERLRH